MSIIVEQTLPYRNSQLNLDDPKRWSRLFPLMRPSIKVVKTSSGQTTVIDTALAKSNDVLLTAVGSIGNLSSKILSESHLAAFTAVQSGTTVSGTELGNTLKDSGFPVENGVVAIRVGGKHIVQSAPGLIDFSVDGELELDHVLSLLLAAKPEVKSAFYNLIIFIHWN